MERLIFFILMLVVSGCQAYRFTCSMGSKSNIDIGHELRSQDFIVPEVENNADAMVKTGCTWNLKLAAKTPRQVLLEGISRNFLLNRRRKRSTGNDKTELRYQSHSNHPCSVNSTSATVSVGIFHVVSLLPGDTVTVTTDKPQLRADVTLRVVSIDKGYCTRDMTAYGDNCYYSIGFESTLMNTLKVIENRACSMQLASFGNLSDIQNFIQANKPKFDVFPIKAPLNLTKPVRIGLFYSKSTGKVYRLTTIGKISKMEAVGNSEDFLSSSAAVPVHQCGSLRVNESDHPVIEFVNCQMPMPALIVFPDQPLDSCVICSGVIENWLRTTETGSLKSSWHIPVAIAIAGVVAVAWLILCIYKPCNCGKHRAGKKNNHKSVLETDIYIFGTKPKGHSSTDLKLSNPFAEKEMNKASQKFLSSSDCTNDAVVAFQWENGLNLMFDVNDCISNEENMNPSIKDSLQQSLSSPMILTACVVDYSPD